MTGAPKIGVTAFKGKRLLVPGTTISKLHNRATQAPNSIVTGTNILWLEDPNPKRAT